MLYHHSRTLKSGEKGGQKNEKSPVKHPNCLRDSFLCIILAYFKQKMLCTFVISNEITARLLFVYIFRINVLIIESAFDRKGKGATQFQTMWHVVLHTSISIVILLFLCNLVYPDERNRYVLLVTRHYEPVKRGLVWVWMWIRVWVWVR